MVNLWFENEKERLKRKSPVDPWRTYDNFRINHHAKREVKLIDKDDKVESLKVEYLGENKFNVLKDKDTYDQFDVILQNA